MKRRSPPGALALLRLTRLGHAHLGRLGLHALRPPRATCPQAASGYMPLDRLGLTRAALSSALGYAMHLRGAAVECSRLFVRGSLACLCGPSAALPTAGTPLPSRVAYALTHLRTYIAYVHTYVLAYQAPRFAAKPAGAEAAGPVSTSVSPSTPWLRQPRVTRRRRVSHAPPPRPRGSKGL